MKTRSAILAATLSAALLSATAAPAAAAPSGQVSVTYSDLDLSTDAGRTELAARYDKAARNTRIRALPTGCHPARLYHRKNCRRYVRLKYNSGHGSYQRIQPENR